MTEASSLVTVKCASCKADNIISPSRAMRCGSCGAALSQLSKKPRSWWLKWLSGRPSGKGLEAPPLDLSPRPIFAAIQSHADRLARASWGTREQIARVPLILRPEAFRATDNGEVVTALLRHVREVAPRLNVPWMTPRIKTERLVEAAGQFEEQDGWVKISVGVDFFSEPLAARAILCHELCHYVLNANGIRERDSHQNERLTDTAMFVLGLGELFLAGYRKRPQGQYRRGHRLGYLSDDEYRWLRSYVQSLRSKPDAFASDEKEGMDRLRAAVLDSKARERLITGYRRRFPSKSPAQIIEAILLDLEKGRR